MNYFLYWYCCIYATLINFCRKWKEAPQQNSYVCVYPWNYIIVYMGTVGMTFNFNFLVVLGWSKYTHRCSNVARAFSCISIHQVYTLDALQTMSVNDYADVGGRMMKHFVLHMNCVCQDVCGILYSITW